MITFFNIYLMIGFVGLIRYFNALMRLTEKYKVGNVGTVIAGLMFMISYPAAIVYVFLRFVLSGCK